jgi:hypothetical protein
MELAEVLEVTINMALPLVAGIRLPSSYFFCSLISYR